MNMGLITQKQSLSIKFIEQNLKFDFKHPNDQESTINAGYIPHSESFSAVLGVQGKDP